MMINNFLEALSPKLLLNLLLNNNKFNNNKFNNNKFNNNNHYMSY